MSKSKKILIAKIQAHQGLSGWLKVNSFSETKEKLCSYDYFFISEKDNFIKLEVESEKIDKSVKLKFRDFESREDTDKLIGKDLYIEQDQLEKLGENEFYWKEILGLNVYLNNDQKIGVVSDIIETGANDVLVITGENTFLVPYLYGQSIKLIDLKSKKLLLIKYIMSNNTKQIYVISVFPEIVENFIKYGVLKRSQDKDLLKINMINLRDFSKNKGQIDDKPYGGGAGMVLQAQPLIDATRFAKSNLENYKCIYLSPKGRKMNQKMVAEAANDEDLIIVAGRYEGVDQRFIDLEVDEEWSIGDYILSGGEVAACVIIDSIARMIPGVLGNDNSNVDDSFSNSTLEYPHYTRPEKVENISVPDVLLSGNHQEIRKWRENQALEETKIKRSDLLKKKLS